MATPMLKITYADKSNPIPVTNRPTQATAEDFNEIKELVNNLVDRANEVGLPGFIYIAFASDDTGTNFTTTFDVNLHYMAIKKSATEIEIPSASDFAGLWRFIMPEAPKDNKTYVRQNGAWISNQGLLNNDSYKIILPSADTVTGRLVGLTEGVNFPTGWVLSPDGNDLVVTHGLDREVKDVVIWSKNTPEAIKRKEIGNAAYSGIYQAIGTAYNSFVIESLATVPSEITIYISFA